MLKWGLPFKKKFQVWKTLLASSVKCTRWIYTSLQSYQLVCLCAGNNPAKTVSWTTFQRERERKRKRESRWICKIKLASNWNILGLKSFEIENAQLEGKLPQVSPWSLCIGAGGCFQVTWELIEKFYKYQIFPCILWVKLQHMKKVLY